MMKLSRLLIAVLIVTGWAAPLMAADSDYTEYTYDALGRPATITKPDGGSVSYAYLPNKVTVTNERGFNTDYHYKTFGNPDDKLLVEIDNGSGVGNTTYDYNAHGDLLLAVLRDASGQTVTYEYGYDNRHFLVYEILPEMSKVEGTSVSIQYTRDSVGNMTGRTDARGTTTYAYDHLDRLTGINYPGDTPDVSYTYHTNSNNIHMLNNGVRDYTYSYYPDNRVQQISYSVEGQGYDIFYAYNGKRNVEEITYPSGQYLTYNYLPDGLRIENVTHSNQGYIIKAVGYHPSGQMKEITYGNNIKTVVDFDAANRPKSIDAGLSNNPSRIVDLTYQFDGRGNVLSIVNGVNGSTLSMESNGYDSLDRLKNVQRSTHDYSQWDLMGYASNYDETYSFAYDYFGNIKPGNVNLGYDFDAADGCYNRLESLNVNDVVLTYDGSGNMNTLNPKPHLYGTTYIRNYTYDHTGRLSQYTFNATGVVCNYYYDSLGNRIKKSDQGVVSLYHYGSDDRLLTETITYTDNSVKNMDYLYLGSRVVAKYLW